MDHSIPDRRTSYSGRPSNSRRSNPAGLGVLGGGGGGGGGGPGSLGLGGPGGPGGSSGRLHNSTSARHQLLVAAANSASRKRSLMLAGGSPSMSPDSYSPHGGGGGGGFNGPLGRHISNNGAGGGYSPTGTAAYGGSPSGFHRAHSEALNQLPYGYAYGGGASAAVGGGGAGVPMYGDGGGHGSRLRGSSNSSLAIGGGGYGGMGMGAGAGMAGGGGSGLSMSYLLAAARRGPVSEPLGIDGVVALSAPSSPARNIPEELEEEMVEAPAPATASLGVTDAQLATFSGGVVDAAGAHTAGGGAAAAAAAAGTSDGATGATGSGGTAIGSVFDGSSAVTLTPADTGSQQPAPVGVSPVVGRDRRAAARRRSITLPDLRLSNSGTLRQLPTPMLHMRGGGGEPGPGLGPHPEAYEAFRSPDEELLEYSVGQALHHLDEDEAAIGAEAHVAQFRSRGAAGHAGDSAADAVPGHGHAHAHAHMHPHAKTHAGMVRGPISGDGSLEEAAGVSVGMSPVRGRGPPRPSGAPSGAHPSAAAALAQKPPGFGGADGTEAVTAL